MKTKGMNTKKLMIYRTICRILPESKCHKLKSELLRWCGAKVGKNCEICSSAKFYGGFNLSIGNNCFIGIDALIFGANGSSIEIEDYAKIGSRVIIVTGTHDFSINTPCIEVDPGTYKNVKICKGCAVSTGSFILPGKTVGTMSHVAAGAVVSKDVPPYTRVGGVPAKVIKNFKEEQSVTHQ